MRVHDDRHHPDYPQQMRDVQTDIGDRIAKALPKGWGFALLIFSFGEGGTMGYISNADRANMVNALREQADHLEGNSRG